MNTELGYHDPPDHEVYRDFTIEPCWSMSGVWDATHKNYDGPESQNSAPYFWSFKRNELFAMIDEWYEEREANE